MPKPWIFHEPEEMTEAVGAASEAGWTFHPPETDRSEMPKPPGFGEALLGEFSEGAKKLFAPAAGPAISPFSPVPSLTQLEGALQVFPPNAIAAAAGKKMGGIVLEATGSPTQAGLADVVTNLATGGIGGVGARLGGMAGRSVLRNLPGASAGMMEEGAKIMRQAPQKYLPTVPSSFLYNIVEEMNPDVTELPRLKAAAEKLLKQEGTLKSWQQENRDVLSAAGAIVDNLSPTVKMTSQQARIPMGEIVETAFGPHSEDVIVGRKAGPPYAQVSTQVPALGQKLKFGPHGEYIAETRFSFQEMRLLLKRLGQRIDDARDPLRRSTGSSEELGAMKTLYRSLLEDLEDSAEAAVGPAAEALKAANYAARREFAVKEMGDIVESGIKAVQAHDLPEVPNFGTMLNNLKKEIKKNELFAKSFQPGEMQEVMNTLEELRRLKIPPPAKGAPAGSYGRFGQASKGGAIGSAIGGYMGGMPGAAIGGTVGSFTGIVTHDVIAKALTSEGGRRLLVQMVKSDPSLLFSPKGMSLLAGASQGVTGSGDLIRHLLGEEERP